ncbi:MAG: radical SAM protein [Planctomycetota bacterium]
MKWKRVLFIYPYGREKKSEFLYNRVMMIPPLGLEVVATAVRDLVEDWMVVDLRVEEEPLEKIIADFRPDLIGISINWGLDKHVTGMIHSLPGMLEAAGLPRDTDIMAGGLFITRSPDEILNEFPEINTEVLGYGENIMRNILERGSPEGLDSVIYRRNGEVVRSPVKTHLSVEHFHIDRSKRRYTYPSLNSPGDTVLTSIGCPMKCRFCKWRENIYGDIQPWIPRSPESVVAEIEEIPEERIYIGDANFAANLNRVDKICDLLIERRIKKLLILEIRINSIAARPELVKKMEKAGFFMFLIGVESPQDRILKRLNKGFNRRVVRKAFDALRQTRIITLGNFMIGNISETRAEMLSISQFARELGIDLISPNKIYAYPDSEFAEEVERAPGYHIHSGRRHYVYSDRIGLNELRSIQHRIYIRFYTPGHVWNMLRKMMLHPMVRELGSSKMARDFLVGFLLGNLTDRRFRKRFFRKLTKRFKKSDR